MTPKFLSMATALVLLAGAAQAQDATQLEIPIVDDAGNGRFSATFGVPSAEPAANGFF